MLPISHRLALSPPGPQLGRRLLPPAAPAAGLPRCEGTASWAARTRDAGDLLAEGERLSPPGPVAWAAPRPLVSLPSAAPGACAASPVGKMLEGPGRVLLSPKDVSHRAWGTPKLEHRCQLEGELGGSDAAAAPRPSPAPGVLLRGAPLLTPRLLPPQGPGQQTLQQEQNYVLFEL